MVGYVAHTRCAEKLIIYKQSLGRSSAVLGASFSPVSLGFSAPYHESHSSE